jgi:hypothetical protein
MCIKAFKEKAIFFLFAACLYGPGFSAIYYVATNGSDAQNGGGSQPWATFAYAFTLMNGGDTLVIRDGSYTQPIRRYYSEGLPDGTAGHYTVVMAEHDFAVTIQDAEALSLQPVAYLQIQGLHFKGTAGLISSHHIKIMRCAFSDAPGTGNTTVAVAGFGCSYILFEDCWAWGTGRYKFQDYQADRVIFRRCVARHDYHYSPRDAVPQAVFSLYDASRALMQNCIAINSGLDQYYLAEGNPYPPYYGGVYVENHANAYGNQGTRFQGYIGLDLTGWAGLNDFKVDSVHTIENSVIWDCLGGLSLGYTDQPSTIRTSHITVGECRGTPGDQAPAWGAGIFTGNDMVLSLVTNSLITRNSIGASEAFTTSDYNNYYENTVNFSHYSYGNPDASPGTHDQYDNPGLEYITRLEAGSPLKGAASDGGDIGANVIFRYGVSGTLWGEPGYDSLTSEPLWPFPNEAEIKKDMASFTGPPGPPDGKRGFCADGNGLYGGPITLTSYIWEYLGNPCQPEICNYSGSVELAAPQPPVSLLISPNPFGRQTNIAVRGLPAGSRLRLSIYDAQGALVRTLPVTGGSGFWDGRNDSGNLAPNGIYLVQVRNAPQSWRGKLIFTR